MSNCGDPAAIFFIEDMISYIFQECRIPLNSPKTYKERPVNLSYNFTPEMGQVLTMKLVQYRYKILSEREVIMNKLRSSIHRGLAIGQQHTQLFCPFTLRCVIDRKPLDMSQFIEFLHNFMAQTADLVIYLYKNHEMDLMSRAILSAQFFLYHMMRHDTAKKFEYIMEHARAFVESFMPS